MCETPLAVSRTPADPRDVYLASGDVDNLLIQLRCAPPPAACACALARRLDCMPDIVLSPDRGYCPRVAGVAVVISATAATLANTITATLVISPPTATLDTTVVTTICTTTPRRLCT